MQNVEIFTKAYCPFCTRAKMLLTHKGVSFQEIDIQKQPELRATMLERSNGSSTVPQIFIGDHHVGGCDDLFALESSQKLDGLLGN